MTPPKDSVSDSAMYSIASIVHKKLKEQAKAGREPNRQNNSLHTKTKSSPNDCDRFLLCSRLA